MTKRLQYILDYLKRRKKVSSVEINLVKNIELFKHLNQEIFDTLSKQFELITYKKDKQIFRQGESADALYVIAKGSVRVYVHDAQGNKIALARLNEGHYFGEQAIIGAASKTRNANIETITDASLIKIPAIYLLQSLKDNKQLLGKLKETGKKQAIQIALSSLNFYTELQEIFKAAGESGHILEIADNKIIFNQGEKTDFAYFILQGDVELLITSHITKKISSIILHQGQFFGEISILTGHPHHVTAIAKTNLKVLAIKSEFIKSHFSQNNKMRQLLSKLQHSYQLSLPYHGIVEQFLGNDPESGLSLTNIFKMDEGRTIVSEMSLENDSFAMSVNNNKNNKVYSYVQLDHSSRKILIFDDQITGVEASGYWEDLPNVCHLILENTKVNESWLLEFTKTGSFTAGQAPKLREQSEIICDCMQVSRKILQDCINVGVTDFEELTARTGACTVCRCCKYRILQMLGENPWLSAVMRKTISHNSTIRSYEVKLLNDKFKNFLLGQHIIIQVKVGENWLERAYTISDTSTSNFRITIKQEPRGAFTQWLFETAPEEFEIFVTQPQGNFAINMDEDKPAVCFAGGIGITPFITYAKSLSDKNNKKKLHVVYCALTASDFVFEEEFTAVSNKMSNIRVSYLDTETQGLLNEERIAQIINSIKAVDVYICGSEGFEKAIRSSLENLNYDKSRIHSEQFVHAGAK